MKLLSNLNELIVVIRFSALKSLQAKHVNSFGAIRGQIKAINIGEHMEVNFYVLMSIRIWSKHRGMGTRLDCYIAETVQLINLENWPICRWKPLPET
jgi:hypothetical protein